MINFGSKTKDQEGKKKVAQCQNVNLLNENTLTGPARYLS